MDHMELLGEEEIQPVVVHGTTLAELLELQEELEPNIMEDDNNIDIDNDNDNDNEHNNNNNVVIYPGLRAMPYIMGNDVCERLGTMGSFSNLMLYLTTKFHMTNVKATIIVNIFGGLCNTTPLLGAFLADAYFGRYKCLAIGSVVSFVGLLLLTLTSAIPSMHPPECVAGNNNKCPGATGWQLGFLYSAFAILMIGAGGIRPCSLAFGADQFAPNSRGVTSFFNWYNLSFSIAAIVSSTVIVYIQSVNWTIGFAIAPLLMFISCVLFFVGTNLYVRVRPQGSIFKSFAQVIVAAARNSNLELPEDLASLYNPGSTNSNLRHTNQFRCLDKAAIITNEAEIDTDGSATYPWRLCSVQQVEEVKCWFRVMPIWVLSIAFNIGLHLLGHATNLQAIQLDKHLGKGGFKIPTASYGVIGALTMTIWLPFYDRILIPIFQQRIGRPEGITILQRMGTGFVLAGLSLFVAGLIEYMRRIMALSRPIIGVAPKGSPISSISAFILVPQLFLQGLAEAFGLGGQMNLYYDQLPENMRSLSQAMFFAGFALTHFSSASMFSILGKNWLTQDLNNGRLDLVYYILSIAEIGAFVLFLVCARWYNHRSVGE